MSSKFVEEQDDKNEVKSVEYFIGCVLIFLMSLCVAIIGVYVRKMQKLHFSLILTHY